MNRIETIAKGVTLHPGDCLDVLKGLEENSIDAVVTDPPYGLEFMGKGWDGADGFRRSLNKADADRASVHGRMSRRGPQYRAGALFQEFIEAVATECLRVLKPGGHLVAFGGTRTYHRMVCGVEDAGFEIRDQIAWLYGSGFPKSHDVSKGIDKASGAQREVVGERTRPDGSTRRRDIGGVEGIAFQGSADGSLNTNGAMALETRPATDAAREWEGWGTAMKPAHEPITVATKPLTIQQHFAILLDYLTDLLEEQTIWFGLNVRVAEANFSAIRAKLDVVTRHIVLDSAKMRVLARFDPARFAEQNSIFHDPGFCVATKTKDDSVPSNARQSSSAASYLALTTPHGPADDLSIQITAMCMSVITAGISENTVSSWVEVSDAILNRANTFTIKTASRLTIALRTWNSLTSPNIIGGTGSLSPSVSPIVLARKPLSEGTVAANVLRWGTGALNIDGCRIHATDKTPAPVGQYGGSSIGPNGHSGVRDGSADALGRWPANVVHDGSDEVVGAFPTELTSGKPAGIKTGGQGNAFGHYNGGIPVTGYGDTGSAARFFYSAKADSVDRIGSKHPTVKPVDLMQWLVRLITPRGGLILDPFAGTGTTGEAAWREGMRAILIERETEYQEDIRRRMALCLAGPEERKRESIKAKMKDKPVEYGPLFFGAI